ncbi:DNA-binding protein [Cryobacterium sp. TMT2-10]|uniref:DNA-binding protein n=1 Tax=Cryobacterium shii TaxID=1259235 RepID=A0AAQ2C7C5_9MICO|nr:MULTISPECIES: helix-turn-helix domain-containing protein [Cryobacterium]TFC49798.1 DNA-binding protein [Cryobacterium shii]TFD16129.1 DNA-binding protein [Cryobacterium sp. TMT4-10]TFD39783.1 DNA-binding protein [Cryobacterium sp. TMT2-10]
MNDSAGATGVGRFLTVADTAEILSLSVGEVLELVRTGELPAIRLGAATTVGAVGTGPAGVWRVERVVLESFIEAKYEEARRMSLWQQSDFGNIPELSGGTIIRPDSDVTRGMDDR